MRLILKKTSLFPSVTLILRCSLAVSSGFGGWIEESLAPGSELIFAALGGGVRLVVVVVDDEFVVFRGGLGVDERDEVRG